MSSSLSSATTDHDRTLHDVQALQRRVCLLRQLGDNARADLMETRELTPAVQDLLATRLLSPVQLQAILAQEENRVRDAALMAELIAPLLQPLGSRNPDAEPPRSPLLAPPFVSDRARSAPDGIADFIDEMLAQPPAPRRR